MKREKKFRVKILESEIENAEKRERKFFFLSFFFISFIIFALSLVLFYLLLRGNRGGERFTPAVPTVVIPNGNNHPLGGFDPQTPEYNCIRRG